MSRLVVSAEQILEQLDRREALDARLTGQNRRDAQTAADMRARRAAAHDARVAAQIAATLAADRQRRAAFELKRQQRRDELELRDAEIVRCTCGAWRLAGSPCRPCSVLVGRQAIA